MFRVVVLLCVVVTSLAKTCDDAPYNNRCTCDFNPYTNGCSSPTGKYTPYQRQFTQACNKHDVCYKCGQTLNVKRWQCDSALKSNMKSTCPTSRWNWKYHECRGMANTFWAATRSGGWMPTFWNYNTYDFCHDSWVQRCMP